MAEIQSNNSRKSGKPKRKVLSTRVDLTPMVDLGFLLITFFIFTTALAEPSGMKFILPADGPPTETAESKTLNLILTAENKIHYYYGNEVGNQGCTDFSPQGVRALIRAMQERVAGKFGNRNETVILIRPTAESSYMNLVDILDEIQIADIKKYALMPEADAAQTQAGNVKNPC